MIKYALIFVLTALNFSLHAQDFGLSQKRVENIKLATVKIIVNGGESIGTGFIINDNKIITCYHVIDRLFSVPNSICVCKFSSGEEVPLKPSKVSTLPGNLDSMIIYDFYIFDFASVPKTKYTKLKLGIWSNVSDGNLTYTCAYPLDLEQQIISVGIMSTQYIKDISIPFKDISKGNFKTKRNEGWLDLTMNNGNSGGAVIRIGKATEEDVVIGIADFKLNPFSDTTQKLINILDKVRASGGSV